jgi:hypothetical protein
MQSQLQPPALNRAAKEVARMTIPAKASEWSKVGVICVASMLVLAMAVLSQSIFSGVSSPILAQSQDTEGEKEDPLGPPPAKLSQFFRPPPDVSLTPQKYRSPLLFDDGTPVRNAMDWARRREEILRYWWKLLGETPPLLDRPEVEYLRHDKKQGYVQYHLRLQTAPDRRTEDAYLLVPDGNGPFPAVLVVFYDSKTGIGEGKGPHLDFARLLVQRGFVTLSLGSSPYTYYPNPEQCRLQPLAFHAYEAANAHRALSRLEKVDGKRIGIVGHSYGGKWAMFASCLYDCFAAAVWSDPGIVFDESRPNVNYWEPWYLGFEPGRKEQRPRGVPNAKNPRTGPYKLLIEQ